MNSNITKDQLDRLRELSPSNSEHEAVDATSELSEGDKQSLKAFVDVFKNTWDTFSGDLKAWFDKYVSPKFHHIIDDLKKYWKD